MAKDSAARIDLGRSFIYNNNNNNNNNNNTSSKSTGQT